MADLSYISCPNPDYVRYKSIVDVLRERRNESPEKEICVQRFPGGGRKSLTYDELLKRSTYIAKYLISNGIKPGDSVAIIGSNSIEWIIGEFAIFVTGAVAVQIYKTRESFAETLKLLNSTKCSAVLVDPDSDETYISDMGAYFFDKESGKDKKIALLLQKSTLSSLPSLDDVTLTAEEEIIPLPRLQPESSAVIFVTSGSTGVPKMVEFTHLSIVNGSYGTFLGASGDRPYETCYNDRPFCWFGGSPLFSILNGNKRVFVDTTIGMKKENILSVWDIIITERCTTAGLLPYAVLDILANMDTILKLGYKLYAIMTGGQLIGSHLADVCGKCTEKLFMVYGSTEVGVSCYIEITPKMEEGHVGSLFPGFEVKIAGDRDETLDRGHLGEILVRSLSMLRWYRNAPEINAASFIDGWFRTGDVGTITTTGKFFVKGKSNDVIKRGGLKVLTSVVEGAISKLPGVREVIVVAVPDSRLLEEVCACYILKDDVTTTEDDLDKNCESVLGDNVLGNKPSYFLRFDSFPTLSNGKTDKVQVKRQALERLNLA
ncbi:long-chain-fatty-acid--CoA ligase FadD13-like [Pecten maximus]|uniref:long-chain-fatty-acid--CoA ligase FadD13-like n=1 Tax=Pecten maximus TaxID=6579 RepID=UPI0014586A77|nr:long-chain-fatty-acid--CoA ligase FadD13-like [Pecten maximus]